MAVSAFHMKLWLKLPDSLMPGRSICMGHLRAGKKHKKNLEVLCKVSRWSFSSNWFPISGWWWLEHDLYFPIYWECHHPNWLIFFRGVQTTNQILCLYVFPKHCATEVKWQPGDILEPQNMSAANPPPHPPRLSFQQRRGNAAETKLSCRSAVGFAIHREISFEVG